jgi:sugar O-acyltransferase (sialic acid O-acetyltransferase NeuD family)
MSGVVVVGAGGHAKVVIATLHAVGHEVAAIVDNDVTRKGHRVLGVPVVGTLEVLQASTFEAGVIAIGNNRVREELASAYPLRWLTVVHPAALVHGSVQLGAGTVVFARAVIQPECIVGEHVIVNTSASVDHDCVIGDFAHIAPGVHLAGNVHVGKGSLLGIGSVAIPGTRIGEHVTIGAGSVLVREIQDGALVYGNPARESRPSSAGP